jgi:hypothetical protein
MGMPLCELYSNLQKYLYLDSSEYQTCRAGQLGLSSILLFSAADFRRVPTDPL